MSDPVPVEHPTPTGILKRRKWEKNQFLIFNSFEILDLLYPNTEGHQKRIERRKTTSNSTIYTTPDQFWFPCKKGHVAALARVALLLSFITETQYKTKTNLDKLPQFSLAAEASIHFDNPEYYQKDDFDIKQLSLVTYAHAGSQPLLRDIPNESTSITAIDWMIEISKVLLQKELTEAEAKQAILETWVIRRVARGLGSSCSVNYYSEEYIFGQFINHKLSSETEELFKSYQHSSDRSMLHDVINHMAQQDFNKAGTDSASVINPEEQNEADMDAQSRANAAQFKCTLPYQQFDELSRSKCASCNGKVHLYCPSCLQWNAFASSEETSKFFEQNSFVPQNPLAELLNPPTLPQHPKVLQGFLEANKDVKKPTAYSRYSPYYTPIDTTLSTKPLESSTTTITTLDEQIQSISTEFIKKLQPLTGLPLPLSIELVHHPGEKLQKSTGLHSCLVSPEQARLVQFPDNLPDYSEEDTVILFPTDDAYAPDDIDWTKYNHCIIVEATWSGTTAVLNHPKLKNLKKVKLHNYQTLFWRNQQFGSAFLATIEAIYYLCREVHMAMIKQKCISPSTVSILHKLNENVISSQKTLSENPDSNHINTSKTLTDAVNGYQYQGELDDLLFLFLLRLRRVLGTYHNLSNNSSNTQDTNSKNDNNGAENRTKRTGLQPKTWTLGLGNSGNGDVQ
jgi:hypothetical protein